MEVIVRYVFRFDYKPCFELLNRPGDALAILSTGEYEKYWDNLGVNRDRFGVNVSKIDETASTFRSLAVEHSNLNGQFRSELGLEADKLIGDDILSRFSKLSSDILAAFQIKKMERVGFRVWILGGESETFSQTRQNFHSNALNPLLLKRLESNSKINDFATTFEGELADGTKYRFSTGPGAESDRTRFLERPPKTERKPHTYSVDLDLYENDIDFSLTTLYRWVKLKQPTIQKFLTISKEMAESEWLPSRPN